MKPLLIIGSIMSLLFVSVVGHAEPIDNCNSYESCMELVPPSYGAMIIGGVIKQAPKIYELRPEDNYFVLKAIAFKLDEISKKLDK